MLIHLMRYSTTKISTIGAMLIDGEFACYTLEDTRRERKIDGETRIPAGRYRVGLRNGGEMTWRYHAMLGDKHKGMLWVLGVPGFEFVYIHIGNTNEDTSGCILVGNGAMIDMITNSRLAYESIYTRIATDIINEKEVVILISDIA